MQGDLPIGCAQPQATKQKQQTTFQGQAAKSSQGCPTFPLRPSVKDTDVSLSVYVILCSQLVESFTPKDSHSLPFFNRKFCCSLALRGVGRVINAIKKSRHLTICHNFETSHKSFVYDGFPLKSITTQFFKLNDLSSLYILFHFK